MQTIERSHETPGARHNARALELLSAIAHRDAGPEDITAELRQDGFGSRDGRAAGLATGEPLPPAPLPTERPIDLRRFERPTPAEITSRSRPRAPRVPFVLNGVIYEPQDIGRFDGRELHSVPAASGDHLLVVDDRAVMARWWLASYLSSPAIPGSTGQTWFWEDADMKGRGLRLHRCRSYDDLGDVVRGSSGLSDWGRAISSVALFGTSVSVLYEHRDGQGSSLTLLGGAPKLDVFGWNDRAESAETW